MTYVLLTRAPLYSKAEAFFRVRLACLRHAASVDSEPGSNSRLNSFLVHNLLLVKYPIMTLLSSFEGEQMPPSILKGLLSGLALSSSQRSIVAYATVLDVSVADSLPAL